MVTIKCVSKFAPESYVLKRDGITVGYARYLFSEFQVTDINYNVKIKHVIDDIESVIPTKYKDSWLTEAVEAFL